MTLKISPQLMSRLGHLEQTLDNTYVKPANPNWHVERFLAGNEKCYRNPNTKLAFRPNVLILTDWSYYDEKPERQEQKRDVLCQLIKGDLEYPFEIWVYHHKKKKLIQLTEKNHQDVLSDSSLSDIRRADKEVIEKVAIESLPEGYNKRQTTFLDHVFMEELLRGEEIEPFIPFSCVRHGYLDPKKAILSIQKDILSFYPNYSRKPLNIIAKSFSEIKSSSWNTESMGVSADRLVERVEEVKKIPTMDELKNLDFTQVKRISIKWDEEKEEEIHYLLDHAISCESLTLEGSSSNFQNSNLKELEVSFACFKSLKSISVTKLKLTESFVDHLKEQTQLESLSIDKCSGQEHFEALDPGSVSHLKKLSIKYPAYYSRPSAALAIGPKAFKSLLLAANALAEFEMDYFSGHYEGVFDSDECFKALYEDLPKGRKPLETVKKMSLKVETKYLDRVFQVSQQLRELVLYSITEKDVSPDDIYTLPKLEQLFLPGFQIYKANEAIDFLNRCPKLRYLCMGLSCYLRFEKEESSALHLPQLEKLRVFQKSSHSGGISERALDLLLSLPRLRDVCLSSLKVGSKETCKNTHKLPLLIEDLELNGVTFSDSSTAASLLNRVLRLKRLKMNYTSISSEDTSDKLPLGGSEKKDELNLEVPTSVLSSLKELNINLSSEAIPLEWKKYFFLIQKNRFSDGVCDFLRDQENIVFDLHPGELSQLKEITVPVLGFPEGEDRYWGRGRSPNKFIDRSIDWINASSNITKLTLSNDYSDSKSGEQKHTETKNSLLPLLHLRDFKIESTVHWNPELWGHIRGLLLNAPQLKRLVLPWGSYDSISKDEIDGLRQDVLSILKVHPDLELLGAPMLIKDSNDLKDFQALAPNAEIVKDVTYRDIEQEKRKEKEREEKREREREKMVKRLREPKKSENQSARENHFNSSSGGAEKLRKDAFKASGGGGKKARTRQDSEKCFLRDGSATSGAHVPAAVRKIYSFDGRHPEPRDYREDIYQSLVVAKERCHVSEAFHLSSDKPSPADLEKVELPVPPSGIEQLGCLAQLENKDEAYFYAKDHLSLSRDWSRLISLSSDDTISYLSLAPKVAHEVVYNKRDCCYMIRLLEDTKKDVQVEYLFHHARSSIQALPSTPEFEEIKEWVKELKKYTAGSLNTPEEQTGDEWLKSIEEQHIGACAWRSVVLKQKLDCLLAKRKEQGLDSEEPFLSAQIICNSALHAFVEITYQGRIVRVDLGGLPVENQPPTQDADDYFDHFVDHSHTFLLI